MYHWFWKLKHTDCLTFGEFATRNEFKGNCPHAYQLVSCNTYTPGATLDSWHTISGKNCYVAADNGENQYATSICCRFTICHP